MMLSERFNHPLNEHYHILPIRGLAGLSLNMLFRRIASSMTGLYIPIFIYGLFHKLDPVFIYFIIVYMVATLINFLVAKVMRYWGVDIALMFGSVFRIIFILLLAWAQYSPNLIFVSAIFYGFTMAFDWLPFHYSLVAISSQQKQRKWGSASGKMEIFARIAGALGPIIGGLIISLFSYQALFAFSSFILFLAAAAPFLDEFNNKGMHLSFKEAFERMKDPSIKKHFFAHGLSVFEINAYAIVWPIILISIFGSLLKLGVFQSFVLLLSLIMVSLSSKYIDKGNISSWNYGFLFSSGHWWVRFFWATPLGLLFSELIFAFSQAMVWLPFTAIIYAESAQNYRLEFLLVRNIVRYISGTIVVFLLWGFYSLSNNPKTMLLIFGMLMLLTSAFKYLFQKDIKYLRKN